MSVALCDSNPRYCAVVRRLPGLPLKTVQNVLSDIEIIKLIDMITLNETPFVEKCIIEHPALGRLFSTETLPEVKRRWRTYLNIIERHRADDLHYPNVYDLNMDASGFISKFDFSMTVLECIHAAILNKLRLFEPYMTVLRAWATEELPDIDQLYNVPYDEIELIFNRIVEAEDAINRSKAIQLRRLVKLLQENKGILKPASSPSQEPIRNHQHIIDKLLNLEERIMQPQFLDGRPIGTAVFGREALFLVPYDRYLQIFLKVLARFPPGSHPYPKESQIVLDGMSVIRNRDKTPTFSRTENTQYSFTRPDEKKKRIGKGYLQPQFNTAPSLRTVSDYSQRFLPCDEKEFDWLEGFVVICRHMSQMQEEWKKGMTVAEYWTLHMGSSTK